MLSRHTIESDGHFNLRIGASNNAEFDTMIGYQTQQERQRQRQLHDDEDDGGFCHVLDMERQFAMLRQTLHEERERAHAILQACQLREQGVHVAKETIDCMEKYIQQQQPKRLCQRLQEHEALSESHLGALMETTKQ